MYSPPRPPPGRAGVCHLLVIIPNTSPRQGWCSNYPARPSPSQDWGSQYLPTLPLAELMLVTYQSLFSRPPPGRDDSSYFSGITPQGLPLAGLVFVTLYQSFSLQGLSLAGLMSITNQSLSLWPPWQSWCLSLISHYSQGLPWQG